MTITGNYSQSVSSEITFILKNTNAALVRVTGNVVDARPLLKTTGTNHLSGKITIRRDGYSPKPGDKIVLFNTTAGGARSSLSTMSQPLRTFSGVCFDLPVLESRMTWDTSSFESDGTISVVGSSSGLLADRPLNDPNPFKLTTGTEIGYWLNRSVDIDLRIYTVSGAEVFQKTLTAGIEDGAKTGYNKVMINQSSIGQDLPSGVYPYFLINE